MYKALLFLLEPLPIHQSAHCLGELKDKTNVYMKPRIGSKAIRYFST